MSRVDELQRKYPDLSREVIVKWETLCRGVRDSDDLDKVSDWVRAFATYQNYSPDVTLKDMVGRRPDRIRPGMIKRPLRFYMKNAIGSEIRLNYTSPYEVREVGDGRFALYEGEEKVEEIYFPRPKQREEPLTSKGTPVTQLVDVRRRCFMIVPVRHCEYFPLGQQCKFCNFNATQEDARAVGLSRAVTIDLEETIEAYKLLSSEIRFIEGRFEMGGFRKSEQETRIYFDFVEKIASGASHKPNLSVHTQPMGRQEMLRLKSCGVDCLTFQMEVWDRDLFAEVCPGKDKYTGHGRYLEAFQEAVDVFGAGNVGAVFVGGVTLLPQKGHGTWQESRDSLVDGFRWMIEQGAFPIFFNLRLGPGSVYGDDRSNREKIPPTEYYLESGLSHHEAMMEFDLYRKLNKFMFCPLDCLAVQYAGEIGMLALNGTPANWLADRMPDEANWLAQFISSIGVKSEP